MSALILQTVKTILTPQYGKIDGAIVEPPKEVLPPVVPQIAPRILLDARELNLEQGATVNNWVGTGTGSIAERTFNSLREGASWTYPKFDTGTIKSVIFDRESLIANKNTTVINPINSYVVVGKATNAPLPSNQVARGRFFTGTIADGFQGFYPLNDRLAMGAGLKNEVDVAPFIQNEWFIAVLVYNGAKSKILLSNSGTIQTIPTIGVSGQSLISLGGNYNFTTPEMGGLLGNIALFAQYDKALSDDEMIELLDYYKTEFSI